MVAEAIATLGENVVIKRVVRLEVDGIVGAYVHAGGKLGVIVGVKCDDSSADALAKDVAMHVAAADPTPLAVSREGISEELIETERSIYRSQAQKEGKPENIIDRIIEGKIKKFISQVCLVDQPFVKDSDRSVGDLLDGATVTAFHRFKLGEASE
jgi:elongation factor Ts